VDGARRDLFDVWSRVYDTSWIQRAVYRPVHDAVVATLDGQPVRGVVDVGCGTGLLTRRLARSHPDARVVGCDLSLEMLEHAARRDSRVSWVQGDAQLLPVRDAVADVVVCTEAYHWVRDQAAALADINRVLVRNGTLLLALVNPRLRVLAGVARVASSAAGEPVRWPTRDELRADLERAGFRVVRQQELARLPGRLLFPAVLTTARTRAPVPTIS
jgi:ubiquinone/menaquinone biosynthesis C-methylase UbiE